MTNTATMSIVLSTRYAGPPKNPLSRDVHRLTHVAATAIVLIGGTIIIIVREAVVIATVLFVDPKMT